MFFIRDSSGNYFYDFFFVIVVLVGAFFIVNLVVAIQFNYYDKVKASHLKRLENKQKKEKKKYVKACLVRDMGVDAIGKKKLEFNCHKKSVRKTGPSTEPGLAFPSPVERRSLQT